MTAKPPDQLVFKYESSMNNILCFRQSWSSEVLLSVLRGPVQAAAGPVSSVGNIAHLPHRRR